MTDAPPTAAPMTTVRVLGPGDPDHLDPASRYHLRPGQVRRLLSRQLFVHAVLDDGSFEPVPDVACAVPTEAGGGVDGTGTRYTIRLRGDVSWNSRPPRAVVADDFVRGFERLAHLGPGSDVLAMFTDVIAGLGEFCERFWAGGSGGRIAGVRATDDRTLVLLLRRPANDLLDLLSLGYAVAVPRENAGRPPGAPAEPGTLVNGPYQVEHRDARRTVLVQNTAWRQETDPVRVREHERIEIDAAGGRANTPAWPLGVVPGRPTAAEFPHDFPGTTLNPYFAFNIAAGGPVADVRVRRAIAHAVDKRKISAVVRRLNGVVAAPVHSVIPPGNLGHDPDLPTWEFADAPGAAELLAAAGHRRELVLRAAVRDIAFQREVVDLVASDLAACGIVLDVDVVAPGDFYGGVLAVPEAWDFALVGWTPDWFGNNGRAVLRPLLGSGGTGNFGGYRAPELDALMERALGAPDRERAAVLWREVDSFVRRELPVLPLLAFACESCAARTGSFGWVETA
ncbi:ABC transporter substrate-binding protein [Saccharopolyspora sp. CA-218241]|uniref:ABC transporter substrate-binding protein n=1 Tax=Saccharopolyspora sp. CA-218241 TaxID=3240027 RepID=UPI003D987CCD